MIEAASRPLLLNVGCGPREGTALPALFRSWRELRVDVDISVAPDIVADLTDLSAIASASVDAIWAAHCLEHLYLHQVPTALSELRRVLRDDGFLCIIVPDLQTVAGYIVTDRLHEAIYQSPAGPVSAHDVLFGFGPALASGQASMAHRCGFTPGLLRHCFHGVPFGEVLIHRRSALLELAVIARAIPARDEAERAALLQALQL